MTNAGPDATLRRLRGILVCGGRRDGVMSKSCALCVLGGGQLALD